MKQIKNIIFDLGGVIFNVDYNLTLKAFNEIGRNRPDEIHSLLKQSSLLDDFELGKISPQMFREEIRKKLKGDLTGAQIDMAWNAMLQDLPKERLLLIKKMSKKFRLFLLSNTNAIHLPAVWKIITDSFGITSFSGYFKKEYYSHLIGLRKPDVKVFELILKENKLEKTATLFVDDSPQHIKGAKKAGLHTLHITGEKTILDYFHNANNETLRIYK